MPEQASPTQASPKQGSPPALWLDGRAIPFRPGASILSALQNVGIHTLRRSRSGEGRGALCGMGVCLECRIRVDGQLRRTCLMPAENGQRVSLHATGEGDGR